MSQVEIYGQQLSSSDMFALYQQQLSAVPEPATIVYVLSGGVFALLTRLCVRRKTSRKNWVSLRAAGPHALPFCPRTSHPELVNPR